MEDVASGLEWTQIGVYMPVRGQAKVTIATSGGTQDAETKDPAQGAWESLSDELDKIHGEYMIGGDFNAETEAFLRGRVNARSKHIGSRPRGRRPRGARASERRSEGRMRLLRARRAPRARSGGAARPFVRGASERRGS